MSPLHAWREGIRRVASAPALLAGVWAATMLVSFPLTLAIRADIVRQLGSSLDAEAAARGMAYDWLQAFARRTDGAGSTLTPSIVGFAGTLDNLSALADGVRRPASIASAVAIYAILWLFFSGGVIERYARRPEAHRRPFLSACGAYFPRFVRLGILMAVVYALLFGALQPWMFHRVYPKLAGAAADRNAFAVRISLYAIFGLLVAAANIVFDYAKVRTVVENRRSMTVGVAAAFRFVRTHPGAAIGVYGLDVLMFAGMLVLYAAIAPGSGGTGATVWLAVLIGQAYIAGRLAVRMLFFASETAAFEDRLGMRRH